MPPPAVATPADDEIGFLGPGFMSGAFSASGVPEDVYASLGEDGVVRKVNVLFYILVHISYWFVYLLVHLSHKLDLSPLRFRVIVAPRTLVVKQSVRRGYSSSISHVSWCL